MLTQISNLEKNIHLASSRFIQSHINATLYTLDIIPDLGIQICVFLREGLKLCSQWKFQITLGCCRDLKHFYFIFAHY